MFIVAINLFSFRVGEEGCDYLVIMVRNAKDLHILDYETRSANA